MLCFYIVLEEIISIFFISFTPVYNKSFRDSKLCFKQDHYIYFLVHQASGNDTSLIHVAGQSAVGRVGKNSLDHAIWLEFLFSSSLASV